MSRDRVYELLAGEPERFRSGEEISRSLGISRAAVWKAVDSLRREGYGIEARTGLGYRLVAAPDALTEREIRRYLTVPCPDLRCFQEIDSTNSYLKREALAGAPHGTAAVADCQSAGRGRMARSFQSPPGKGVYLSVLLRPQLPPQPSWGPREWRRWRWLGRWSGSPAPRWGSSGLTTWCWGAKSSAAS